MRFFSRLAAERVYQRFPADYFKTTLYTGNAAARSIVNGLRMNAGGMVLTYRRDSPLTGVASDTAVRLSLASTSVRKRSVLLSVIQRHSTRMGTASVHRLSSMHLADRSCLGRFVALLASSMWCATHRTEALSNTSRIALANTLA